MTPAAVYTALGEYQARLVSIEFGLFDLAEAVAVLKGKPKEPPKPRVLPEPYTLSGFERRERGTALVMRSWRNYGTYDHLSHRATGDLLRGHMVHRMGSYHGTDI